MVDARGVSLSIVVTGANRHDVKLVGTLDASLGLPLQHAPASSSLIVSSMFISGGRQTQRKRPRLLTEVIAGGRRPAEQSLKTNDEITRSDRAGQMMGLAWTSSTKASRLPSSLR